MTLSEKKERVKSILEAIGFLGTALKGFVFLIIENSINLFPINSTTVNIKLKHEDKACCISKMVYNYQRNYQSI